nr:nicotinate phosphoribosyltransferase [Quercus suber]
MAGIPQDTPAMPDGIFSLLDTDLYKLTMQCAILKYYPNVQVSYKFTNRTPHMQLNQAAYRWLQTQIGKLENVTITAGELKWLKETCPYLTDDYLSFLQTFTFRPAEHLQITFEQSADAGDGDAASGHVDIQTKGRWVDTILYEIPLLALVSEAYFKFVDRDWTHAQQQARAHAKARQLLEHGCVFSEFGTRRRRDYATHALVLQGLVTAQREHASAPGRFTGTSNVHMAMRFGVAPIGTVAHEWFMAVAAIHDSYANANETALRLWLALYGPGVLGIALTDTFGTSCFLSAFARSPPFPTGNGNPASSDASDSRRGSSTYAELFTGVRQDSGDPLAFIAQLRAFYTAQGILPATRKTLVFSDALDVAKCIRYEQAARAAGFAPSFGIGTFFTNDFIRASSSNSSSNDRSGGGGGGGGDDGDGSGKESGKGEKSAPLNIVIKLSEAAGRAAIKLSDDVGKNMGDEALVSRIKREVGYEERRWEGGDEARRWEQ